MKMRKLVVARFDFASEDLQDLLELPMGVEVRKVYIDDRRNAICFVLESELFDVSQEGAELPDVFLFYKTNNKREKLLEIYGYEGIGVKKEIWNAIKAAAKEK